MSKKKLSNLLFIILVIIWGWWFTKSLRTRSMMRKNNTLAWALIVKVDTCETIYGDTEYEAECRYKVDGKEYTITYPGFKRSPWVGMPVPIYYNEESPKRNTYLGENTEIIQYAPEEFHQLYLYELKRQKSGRTQNKN